MKKIESIENQLNRMNEKYKSVRKRKWMNRLATLVFLLFSFIMAMTFILMESTADERMVANYLSTSDYDTLSSIADNADLRNNPEVNDWYQEQCLGINANIALAGISRNCDANTNYHNKVSNVEAYINDTGKAVVKVDEVNVFTSENAVSEVIATPINVYFIDNTDNNLYEYNVEQNESNEIISDDVQRFALYGNYIFYTNNNDNLRRFSLDTRTDTIISTNVQRFYISDNLIVQDGTNIYKLGINGGSYEKLKDNSLLLGVDSENVYFTNFGVTPESMSLGDKQDGVLEEDTTVQKEHALYSMNIKTREVSLMDRYERFIRAVYIIDGDVVVDIM